MSATSPLTPRSPLRLVLEQLHPAKARPEANLARLRERLAEHRDAADLGSAIHARAEFRAAVGKVDITPESPQMLRGYSPRISTKVRDPLYHRIVAMANADTMRECSTSSRSSSGIPFSRPAAEHVR